MSSALLLEKKRVCDQIRSVNTKFTNLNLNEPHSCSNNVKNTPFVNNGLVTSSHKEQWDKDKYSKRKEASLNKSTHATKAYENYCLHDKNEKTSKHNSKRNSNTNSSTLSLHIAAYENSIEIENQEELLSLENRMKQIVDNNEMITHNELEFPRQQEESATSDPAIMQFKASQKLLDPNKHGSQKCDKEIKAPIYLDCKTLNNIFKSPSGAQKSEWRRQILCAVGFSQYLPSKKILWSLVRIERETTNQCKRLIVTEYHTKSVLIGDSDEWEKVSKAEIAETESQNVTEEEDLLEKMKNLELELQKEKEKRIKAEEKNDELEQIVKIKDEQLDDLDYRFGVQLKRTIEISDKLHDKEEVEKHLLNKMKEKDMIFAKVSQQKDTTISELWGKLKAKDEVVEQLQDSISKKDEKASEITNSMQKLSNKYERLRHLNHSKSQKLNSKGVSSKSTTKKRVKEVEAPIEKKKAKVQVMENLKEYSFEFMMLCVQLSWLGIFDTKIVEALRLITSFFDISISRIPDRRTIGKWCNEFSVMIDVQLDKIFETASNLTLHSDETTLNSEKIQAFVFCVIENGTRKYFVAGFEKVPDKSAARSLKALLDCLKRSIKPLENLNDDTVTEILTERLGKIKNVVSDRASTQKKFNKDLWQTIVSLIPGTPKLNEIFCHHHIMASSWDVFVKFCLIDERVKFDCPTLNFSTLQTAVQFISSNYGNRSNIPQKAKEWNEWAAKNGLKNTSFPSKFGARWNIGPAICSRLLLNRKRMLKFLKDTNYIVEDSHASLVKVLECPVFIVQLQIGAWMDQIINGPWWSELESEKHIIELNLGSVKIIEFLDIVAEDPTLFNNDEIFPMHTKRSATQIELRNTVLADPNEQFFEILPQFCKDFSLYLNKQLNSLLEDDVINDEANRAVLASAAATNKSPEQAFGMGTDMRHLSTSKSIQRIGANVAGVKNKTMEFINNLKPNEYEDLRTSFKAAKNRHRLQRLEEKKMLEKEIVEHHEKNQEKQRKKKKKASMETNFDKFIGQKFTEKWGEDNTAYYGSITKKIGESYEVYYPNHHQYDIFTVDELKDLAAAKKLTFFDYFN